MQLKKYKYVLPTLFIGMNAFALNMNEVSQFLDKKINQANSKLKNDICSELEKEEESLKSKNKIWNSILQEIQKGKISYSIDGNASNGSVDLSFGLDIMSRYYSPGVYLGTDKFNLNLALAIPALSRLSLAVSDAREVTFTRKYNTKCNSIVRVPYNPLSRMPLTKKSFDNLEVGELVTYSAPMTISLGASVSSGPSTMGLAKYISADMQVNIFKIDNKHARVKLVAKKNDGFVFNLENRAPLVSSATFNLLSLSLNSTETDSHQLDYIFDLSNMDAAEAFQKIVSPTDIINLSIKNDLKELKSAVIKDQRIHSLFIDTEAILDANKDNKAIIKVTKTNGSGKSTSQGVSSNFINTLKYEKNVGYSDSTIKVSDANNQIASFFNSSIEQLEKSKLLNYNKEENYNYSSIVTDINKNPMGFMLQKRIKVKKSSPELMKAWQLYLSNLPMASDNISEINKLKELQSSKYLDIVENFYIDASQIMIKQSNFQHDNIKNVLNKIFEQSARANKMFVSIPSENSGTAASPGEHITKHRNLLNDSSQWNRLSFENKMNEFKHLYSYEFNTVIPQYLSQLVDTNLTSETRRLAFNALIQSPLFNEVVVSLIIGLIDDESIIKKSVVYHTEFKVEDKKIVNIQYGDTDTNNYLFTQNAQLSKTWSMETGVNVSEHLKKDGSNKTVQEIISNATFLK